MAEPRSSLHYMAAAVIKAPTSRAVENIAQQIQTRPAAPTLKPHSHIDSAASMNLGSCWSFLFIGRPLRPSSLYGERMTTFSHCQLLFPPGGLCSHTGVWHQGAQGLTKGSAGEGALLAVLCCLFPLLIARAIAGSKYGAVPHDPS